MLLTHLDGSIDDLLPNSFSYWIFGGDADAARSILSTLAGSLITVTSLTFSLTVVTLQLASSQFSPRLLRTFTSDRTVQGTLALFLGTFVFALTVLRRVRSSTETTQAFVPQISITVAYLLTIASVVGLVLFLAHLAQEIRVETMLQTVHQDASATARRTLSELETSGDNDHEPGPGSAVLVAGRSGFVTDVRTEALFDIAVELDVMILVTAPIGSSVVESTPAGRVWPRDAERQPVEQERQRLQEGFDTALRIGFERTAVNDVSFGLRQLTDIAAKALSPGINDPTTATHALGHSSALLCEFASLPLGDELIRDDDGSTRVVVRRPTFAGLLRLGIDQPRRYGASEPQVAERLFQLLAEVAWIATTADQRRALRAELDRLRAAVSAAQPDQAQRLRYRDLADLVADTVAGRSTDAPR